MELTPNHLTIAQEAEYQKGLAGGASPEEAMKTATAGFELLDLAEGYAVWRIR